MHLLLIDAFLLLGLHYLLSLPSTFGAQRSLICSRPAVIKMSLASRRPLSRQMMPLLTKPAEEHRDHIEHIHLQVSRLTSASSGDSTAQGISRIVGDRGILNAGGAWDRPSVTPNPKVSMGRHGVIPGSACLAPSGHFCTPAQHHGQSSQATNCNMQPEQCCDLVVLQGKPAEAWYLSVMLAQLLAGLHFITSWLLHGCWHDAHFEDLEGWQEHT